MTKKPKVYPIVRQAEAYANRVNSYLEGEDRKRKRRIQMRVGFAAEDRVIKWHVTYVLPMCIAPDPHEKWVRVGDIGDGMAQWKNATGHKPERRMLSHWGEKLAHDAADSYLAYLYHLIIEGKARLPKNKKIVNMTTKVNKFLKNPKTPMCNTKFGVKYLGFADETCGDFGHCFVIFRDGVMQMPMCFSLVAAIWRIADWHKTSWKDLLCNCVSNHSKDPAASEGYCKRCYP